MQWPAPQGIVWLTRLCLQKNQWHPPLQWWGQEKAILALAGTNDAKNAKTQGPDARAVSAAALDVGDMYFNLNYTINE